MSISLRVACLLIAGFSASADDEPILANRASGPITMDGELNEASWGHTHPIPLRRHWDAERPWPQHPGEAFAVWDEEALFVACRLVDHDLHTANGQQDGDSQEDDGFVVFISIDEDAASCFAFHVNASGATHDRRIPHPALAPAGAQVAWKSGFVAATALTGTLNTPDVQDEGWSAELRIPWNALGVAAPHAGMQLRFLAARYNYRDDGRAFELSASAPLTESSLNRIREFNALALWEAAKAETVEGPAENE